MEVNEHLTGSLLVQNVQTRDVVADAVAVVFLEELVHARLSLYVLRLSVLAVLEV